MTTPPRGVRPMVVSTGCPSWRATRLAPLPGCAMHVRPVPDRCRGRHTVLVERVEYLAHRIAVVAGLEGCVRQDVALRTPQPEATVREPESLDRAVRQPHLRVAAHPIEGKLQR